MNPDLPVASPWRRYGMAVLSVLVVVVVRLVFMSSMEPRAVFVTFYPAVMLTALHGGVRAGFLATLLSALAGSFFQMESRGKGIRNSSDLLSVAAFLAGCAIIILIIEAMHRARNRVVAVEARLAGQAAEHLRDKKELRLERDLLKSAMSDARAARLHAEQVSATLQQCETEKQASEDAIRLAWGQSAIDMINAMSEGVILQEIDGTIISVNPAVETMTGITGGAVIGRNVRSILGDFLRDEDLIGVRHGLVTMRPGRLPRLPPVIVLRHADKVVRVIPTVTFVNTPESGRRMILLTLKDVTQLYETERKYRELVENANSAIMRVTPDHTISFFNEYAQHLFGYTQDEVLGRHVVGTIVPEVDSEGRDMRTMVRTVIANPEQYASNENENMCKDGRRVWVHWANRAIRDTKGAVSEILCVGTDITERKRIQAENKRYHERLRALAEQLSASEEQKRWQISRYVHDTIIQNLSLSSMRLGATQKALAAAGLEHEVDTLQMTRNLVNDAIAECRTVMSDLTPSLLYELGLVPALKDLGNTLQKQHGVRVYVEEEGTSAGLAAPLRGMLFQSARELIMNALKHADACAIRVDVIFAADKVQIRVHDDGMGFDPSMLEHRDIRQGGFGLFGIRQRLENLGGRLVIVSAPGKGATATLDLPLTDSRETV